MLRRTKDWIKLLEFSRKMLLLGEVPPVDEVDAYGRKP